MNIVFDSNILIAAFATRGFCNEIFEVTLAQHTVYCSEPILKEVEEKLLTKIKIPAEIVNEIITFLRKKTRLVVPSPCNPHACRDINDLMILGTLESSNADILLTGDQDLLILKHYKNSKILNPRQFLEFLK